MFNILHCKFCIISIYMLFHWFDIITFIMLCIFIFGFIFNIPIIFIQINFFIKVSIAIYLMYKFNDFRKKIEFTTLDKKICFSAGFYIFIFSFADVINSYFIHLRTMLLNTYNILNKIEKKIIQT
jgi:hypothetical protein